MLRFVCAALFVSLAAASAEATMVVYYSDEELFDAADVVVQGTVWRSADGDILTAPTSKYEIEAVECFKGCRPGEWILMDGPIGFVGAPSLERESRVIVYLKRVKAEGKEVLVPISLGMSIYKLKYHGTLRRFIARRQIDQLSVMRPANAARGEPMSEVPIARDRFATELLDELRAAAGKRGTR